MSNGKRTRWQRRTGFKRSKDGCLQCRQRRKKCSYDHPVCKSCEDRSWSCTYPLDVEQSSDLIDTMTKILSPSVSEVDLASDILWDVFSPTFSSMTKLLDSTQSEPEMCSNMLLDVDSQCLSASQLPPKELDLDPFSLLGLTQTQKELVHHFTVAIASVISYYREERPFRQLILTMLMPSENSSTKKPLLSSVCAVAEAHKSYALGNTVMLANSYYSNALEQVVAHMDLFPTQLEDEAAQNNLLTSILLLIYYEIARGGSVDSVYSHLTSAYQIISSFLNHIIHKLEDSLISSSHRTLVSLSTIFLLRLYQYFDVITSLSSKRPMLDSSLIVNDFLLTQSRIQTKDRKEETLPRLDPVIGLAEDMWPLIVRLCVLCNESKFGKVVSVDIMLRASFLQLQLSSWEVPESANLGTAADLAMQSAAKVFQLSAQIYLLRTFYPRPKVSDQIRQQVRAALDHLARVCTMEGNMAALLWPISVLANECVESLDRGFIKVVFQKLGKRQGMGNVLRSLEVIEASWMGLNTGNSVMCG
ncbi:fungal-specific transcription factor domain-containing protein [Lipomyces oligophaga]|uniref:fungal-specific transcription factor domain-containing protein n=1 Tax=Lipomyces oligophaga TaxID=45792 RepID=UPI0034CDE5E4